MDQVTEYYRTNYAGRVERPGLGEVMLDRHSVKDSYYHGIGRNKVAAFVAVPDVIERGVVIDEQENWKDRGYNSLTLAAPIKLAGEGYVCAVVIKQAAQTGTNRFYLHEVYLQKDLQEASMGEEPLGDGDQGAISTRNEPSPHPDAVANVLRDYVRT